MRAQQEEAHGDHDHKSTQGVKEAAERGLRLQPEECPGPKPAEYPAYAKDCLDEDTAGASRMLTGEKPTKEEMATLEARKKARDERCKPQADHLADLQRQSLAAQQ